MAAVTRTRYRVEREKLWQELAELLAQTEKRSWRRMPAEDLERLAALYRRAATHLAQIRDRPTERRAAAALNDLVVRAHAQIYRPDLVSWPRRLVDFLQHGFPRAIRATWRLQLLAWGFTVLGFLLGWVLTLRNPDFYYAAVPTMESRSPGASVEELAATLSYGRDSGGGELSAFSGMLWQHNSRVAILVFAGGVLAGVPTLLLLLYNGLMLGAMTAVFQTAGLGTGWWAWILGHGVTEIWAVVIAGCAGLTLGHALLAPGRQSRRRSVATTGRLALRLVLGTVPMLFAAALLEGFFRQSEAETGTRFGVAVLTGLLWTAYFLSGRRSAGGAAVGDSAAGHNTPAPRMSR